MKPTPCDAGGRLYSTIVSHRWQRHILCVGILWCVGCPSQDVAFVLPSGADEMASLSMPTGIIATVRTEQRLDDELTVQESTLRILADSRDSRGLHVEIYGGSNEQTTAPLQSGKPNEILGIQPGKYRIVVRSHPSPFVNGTGEVVIVTRPSQRHDVFITLKPTVGWITFVDPSGKPLENYQGVVEKGEGKHPPKKGTIYHALEEHMAFPAGEYPVWLRSLSLQRPQRVLLRVEAEKQEDVVVQLPAIDRLVQVHVNASRPEVRLRDVNIQWLCPGVESSPTSRGPLLWAIPPNECTMAVSAKANELAQFSLSKIVRVRPGRGPQTVRVTLPTRVGNVRIDVASETGCTGDWSNDSSRATLSLDGDQWVPPGTWDVTISCNGQKRHLTGLRVSDGDVLQRTVQLDI